MPYTEGRKMATMGDVLDLVNKVHDLPLNSIKLFIKNGYSLKPIYLDQLTLHNEIELLRNGDSEHVFNLYLDVDACKWLKRAWEDCKDTEDEEVDEEVKPHESIDDYIIPPDQC